MKFVTRNGILIMARRNNKGKKLSNGNNNNNNNNNQKNENHQTLQNGNGDSTALLASPAVATGGAAFTNTTTTTNTNTTTITTSSKTEESTALSKQSVKVKSNQPVVGVDEDILIAAFKDKCNVSPSNSNSNRSDHNASQEKERHQRQQREEDGTASFKKTHVATNGSHDSHEHDSSVPSYLRPTVSSIKKESPTKTTTTTSSSTTKKSPASASAAASDDDDDDDDGKGTVVPSSANASTTAGTGSGVNGKPSQPRSEVQPPSSTESPAAAAAAAAAAAGVVASQSPKCKKEGTCCSNKNTRNNHNAVAANVGTGDDVVCCGCGDNCQCCIENGWSYCQCGPNCRCSHEFMTEPAVSLLLQANNNATTTSSSSATTTAPEQQQQQQQSRPPLMDDLEAQQNISTDTPTHSTATTTTGSNNDNNNKNNRRPAVYYVDIVVGGMTCTMCSQALTNALNAMEQVRSVTVSLSTDVAHVEFVPPSSLSPSSADYDYYTTLVEQVQETISDIGYTVVDVMTMPNMTSKTTTTTTAATTTGGSSHDNDATIRGDDNGNNNSSQQQPTQQDNWNRIARRQEEKLRSHKRDFLWSLVGTLPILLLTMVLPHILPQSNSAMQWWHKQHVHLFHKQIAVESLVLWFLATPVQFICGYTFYKSSYYNIFRTGTLGMDVLVALGTTSSYGYALYATMTNHVHESHFFETSAVLICFVLLGKWMQAFAVHRTSDALSHLMQLQPATAVRVVPVQNSSTGNDSSSGDNKSNNRKASWNPMTEAYREETVPTNDLQQGDVVKIFPGSSIPADGKVLAGELSVDESMVTGESLPVLKTKGSVVLGGTVCVESSTENASTGPDTNQATGGGGAGQVAFCEVTGVGSSTALAQIIQLVQDAQASKVPMQNFADTVSSVFVPVVVTTSIVTFLVWYALCSSQVVPEEWYTDLHEDSATFSLMFAISCLVISCPCALGLATPTAVMVGTGMGAKLGILMKGGEALEAASKVNAVVLDKTGTVTKGIPAVTDFMPLAEQGSRCCSNSSGSKKKKDPPKSADGKPLSKETMLWLLASLERSSEHPLANAIVSYAEEVLSKAAKDRPSYLEERPFLQPSEFRSMTGRGASGYMKIDANDSQPYHVAVGNRAFFASLDNPLTEDVDDQMKVLEEQGKTAILGAINNQFCVVLGVADELKSDAAATVAYLRNVMKIDVWMVTGDNARTAQAIASQLNLPPQRVVSEALPNAKVHQVRKLQQKGFIVAHVGDGINDSPALAQADVGISMGTGAAIAAEASDMVLVRGHSVADVCTALDLCRVIFSRIKWNFMWSLIYNCLGIPLAAGVCFPFIHTRLPPTVAALAMALSSVSVVFSSLALRLYRPPAVDAPTMRTTGTTSATRTASNGNNVAAGVSDDLREPLLANNHLPEAALEEGLGQGIPTVAS